MVLGKRYFSDKTLAKELDCHPSTVWRMVQRGELPKPIKIGNLTRWEVADSSETVSEEAA